MNDKVAFKILVSISVIICIFIVIFNAWVGPSLVPTYKEYQRIFDFNDSNVSEYKTDLYKDDNEDDNEDDEELEEEIIVVNINEADVDELMMIPYVGEVLANKIIDYRQKYGPFKSEEDLLNIEGIGYKKLESMIDYISLE